MSLMSDASFLTDLPFFERLAGMRAVLARPSLGAHPQSQFRKRDAPGEGEAPAEPWLSSPREPRLGRSLALPDRGNSSAEHLILRKIIPHRALVARHLPHARRPLD